MSETLQSVINYCAAGLIVVASLMIGIIAIYRIIEYGSKTFCSTQTLWEYVCHRKKFKKWMKEQKSNKRKN